MNNLAFSPDGHLIVAARNTLRDGTIFVLEAWDSKTGEKVASVPQRPNATEHSGMISPCVCAQRTTPRVRKWTTRFAYGTLPPCSVLKGCTGILLRSGRWLSRPMVRAFSAGQRRTVRLWPTNAAAREMFYERQLDAAEVFPRWPSACRPSMTSPSSCC